MANTQNSQLPPGYTLSMPGGSQTPAPSAAPAPSVPTGVPSGQSQPALPPGYSLSTQGGGGGQATDSPVGNYVGEMGQTYADIVSAGFSQLAKDYHAVGDAGERGEGLWDSIKRDVERKIAAGRLPLDAMQAVIGGPIIQGITQLGFAKPVAHVMHGAFELLPGADDPITPAQRKALGLPESRKTVIPSEEQIEGDIESATSAIGPETGFTPPVSPMGPMLPMTGPRRAPLWGGSPVPTINELYDAAKAAYRRVDNSGARIEGRHISQLHNDVLNDLRRQGHDPIMNPRTERALVRLREMATQGMTSLQEMDILRRIGRLAARSAEDSDREFGAMFQRHIDSFIDNLGSQHMVGGRNDAGAIQALGEARSAWRRMSRAETIASLFDKAETSAAGFSQAGMENALRKRLISLANNDAAMRRFSPDEQAMIRQAARGGPIQNILRWAGKLAPHGIVSMMGPLLAYHEGGLPAALAVAGGGKAAQMGAEAIMRRNVGRISTAVRSGHIPPRTTLRSLGVTRPQAAAVAGQLGIPRGPNARDVNEDMGP